MECERVEPGVDELLRDCAARLLMRSDGVEESRIHALLASVNRARRLHAGAMVMEASKP